MFGPRMQALSVKRFRRESSGAAMVEFAIVAPLLFALIFGIIDFGRVFFLYNNLTNAAREGARLGAVLRQSEAATFTQIVNATRARINDPGGATARVCVTYAGALPATTVRVEIVNYRFTPVTFLVIRGVRQLNVRAEFRVELQSSSPASVQCLP